MIVTDSGPFPKHRARCEVCEEDRQFVAYRGEEPWCQDCGVNPSMLEPDNYPGGCPEHPNATHEQGYGLAGGGIGVYSVCNECNAFFDIFNDPEYDE